jgi:enamine deaminase RidA (YjgF/YER057c/UK114 family)
VSGQIGFDRDGNLAGDFRAQAAQVFENLKRALAAAGAEFRHVVKMNVYMIEGASHLAIFREVRDAYLNMSAPPASTLVYVPKLAREGLLIEIEAIAVLPPA